MPQGTGGNKQEIQSIFQSDQRESATNRWPQKVKRGNKVLGINKNPEEKESDLGIEGKKKTQF